MASTNFYNETGSNTSSRRRHRLGLALGLGPLFDLGPEILDLLMKGRDILRSPLWGIAGFLGLSHSDKFGLNEVIHMLVDMLPRYD